MPDRERAPCENLPGQLDMWKDYAMPAVNSVRVKNPPPEPGCRRLLRRRRRHGNLRPPQRGVALIDEVAAAATNKTTSVTLTAIAQGM